jgi:hypothetical protein
MEAAPIRDLDLCGLDEYLERHPIDAARTTRGVRTRALADDSTLVPSGYRATG